MVWIIIMADAAAAAPAQPQFPQLTLEQAREALDEALATLTVPANMDRLIKILEECKKIEDPMQQQMAKMSQIIPVVQELLGESMKKKGFDGPGAVMAGVMQIQMKAMEDPAMMAKVQKVMQALQGNFDAIQDDGKSGEECD